MRYSIFVKEGKEIITKWIQAVKVGLKKAKLLIQWDGKKNLRMEKVEEKECIISETDKVMDGGWLSWDPYNAKQVVYIDA
jgi:hypothetical protein